MKKTYTGVEEFLEDSRKAIRTHYIQMETQLEHGIATLEKHKKYTGEAFPMLPVYRSALKKIRLHLYGNADFKLPQEKGE